MCVQETQYLVTLGREDVGVGGVSEVLGTGVDLFGHTGHTGTQVLGECHQLLHGLNDLCHLHHTHTHTHTHTHR